MNGEIDELGVDVPKETFDIVRKASSSPFIGTTFWNAS